MTAVLVKWSGSGGGNCSIELVCAEGQGMCNEVRMGMILAIRISEQYDSGAGLPG